MGIRQVMQESLPDIFDAMGEDAVFIVAGGTPINCKAFIDFGVALEPEGFEGMAVQRGIIIEALLSVLEAEPKRGDNFVIDDITYEVGRVLANDGFTVKLAVKAV